MAGKLRCLEYDDTQETHDGKVGVFDVQWERRIFAMGYSLCQAYNYAFNGLMHSAQT